MERLPDELVCLILDQLSGQELAAAGRVCARWRRLASRRVCRVRSVRDLCRLADEPKAVTVVQVEVCLDFLRQFLYGLSILLPRLRELTLHSHSPLGLDHLRLLTRLPHLRHLDCFTSKRIIDDEFLPIAMQLESLVINDRVAAGFLSSLAHSQRLRELHMFGGARLYPAKELTALLLARAPYLKALTLRCEELPPRGYAAIAKCVSLTSLQLYGCWLLRRDAALLLPRSLHHLRRLHLTGARMLWRTSLEEFLAELRSPLGDVSLSGTSFMDGHVASLAATSPLLEDVELLRTRVSPEGLVALVASLPQLQSLRTDLILDRNQLVAVSQGRLRELWCGMPGSASPTEVPLPGGGQAREVGLRSEAAAVFHYSSQHHLVEPESDLVDYSSDYID